MPPAFCNLGGEGEAVTVAELIDRLLSLPPDVQIVTNECEATSSHERLSNDVDVALQTTERFMDNRSDRRAPRPVGAHVVFIGSSGEPWCRREP